MEKLQSTEETCKSLPGIIYTHEMVGSSVKPTCETSNGPSGNLERLGGSSVDSFSGLYFGNVTPTLDPTASHKMLHNI